MTLGAKSETSLFVIEPSLTESIPGEEPAFLLPTCCWPRTSPPGAQGWKALAPPPLARCRLYNFIASKVAPAARPDEGLKVLRIRRGYHRLGVNTLEFDRLGGEEDITIQRRVVCRWQTRLRASAQS